MSFGDFNHDGHTSLPEAMYGLGMLENGDGGANRGEVYHSSNGCLGMAMAFFAFPILTTFLCYALVGGN